MWFFNTVGGNNGTMMHTMYVAFS